MNYSAEDCEAEPWNGVTDYVLLRENGEVLAVVEAKKTGADVRQAQAQLEYSVTEKKLVQHQFEAYITAHNYNADQIRFLRAVQSVFLQKRRLDMADLYEPPLTNFGADAVDRWFSQQEVAEMVQFVEKLAL